MKSFKLALVVVLAVMGVSVFAQDKTDSIKVNGNCGMCKKRIEKSVKVDGVKTASWDADLQVLTVTYDSTKISNDEIQKKVAAVGHDTEKYKATDATYEKLPGCCLYDRKKETSAENQKPKN